MLRRRLSLLGRMVAWAASRCQGDRAGIPIVFASRYGDAGRSLSLLNEFAAGEAMSPADFALSVHNAIGAMYSIARNDTHASSSVAAGAASAAAACIEAACLLADGADEAMVVCYDAPLPDEYLDFEDEPCAPYAWAWRVSPPDDQAPAIELEWRASDRAAPQPLPFGLDALRFAIGDDATWERECGGRRWCWSRHA